MSSVALVGLSGGAGASVQRYQFETLSVTVAVFSPAASSGNVHQYTATLNPCDGSFSGTGGGYFGLGGSEYVTESVSGFYVSGSFSLNSTYDGITWGNPYTYSVGPVAIPFSAETATTIDTWSSGVPAGTYNVWVTLTETPLSSFANHGQYVASMGGGSDAAHSCIGKPIQSQS